jgi:hypothetical protein
MQRADDTILANSTRLTLPLRSSVGADKRAHSSARSHLIAAGNSSREHEGPSVDQGGIEQTRVRSLGSKHAVVLALHRPTIELKPNAPHIQVRRASHGARVGAPARQASMLSTMSLKNMR